MTFDVQKQQFHMLQPDISAHYFFIASYQEY